jgi:ribonuclease Y
MVYLFLLSILGGFIAWLGIMRLIPTLERRMGVSQRLQVLAEAKNQAEKILSAAHEQTTTQLTIMAEEVASSLEEQQRELDAEMASLDESETDLDGFVERVEKRQARYDGRLKEHEAAESKLSTLGVDLKQTQVAVAQSLCQATQLSFETELIRKGDALIAERTIEQQRLARQMMDELNTQSRGLASRLLFRSQNRYAPNFVWPKPSSTVEVVDSKLAERIQAEEANATPTGCVVLLRELSGASAHVNVSDAKSLSVRFAGGFGIHREAARLSFEQFLQNPKVDLVPKWFKKHVGDLEGEAKRLGRIAVNTLRLKGMDDELQRLVGALNWRTSYRQNQWHHTVEVAQLAGLLAFELGVSVEDAKRVGLLHDIGKALDFSIEGSHAVISGDYADRFGEKRYICDAVMSHHADLIVHSPLAFVLQAADTLSGARPGARVNLEEGYQIRLTALHEVILSFPQVQDIAVMNGGREVHIQVKNNQVPESQLKDLAEKIAHKIEDEIAFPGQIKVLLSRTYESVAVA